MRRYMIKSTTLCLAAFVSLTGGVFDTKAADPEGVLWWDEQNPPSEGSNGPNSTTRYFDMDWCNGYLHWQHNNNTLAYSFQFKINEGMDGCWEDITESTGDPDLDYNLRSEALSYTYWPGSMQERIIVHDGNPQCPDATRDWLKKVKYAGYLQDLAVAGPDGATGKVRARVLLWPAGHYPTTANSYESTTLPIPMNWAVDEGRAVFNLPFYGMNYMLIHWEAP